MRCSWGCPCLTWMDPVSSMGSPQALLSPSGDASGNVFKKQKKKPDRLKNRGGKKARDSPAGTRVSEEGEGGAAPGIRAVIPSQNMEEPTEEQEVMS